MTSRKSQGTATLRPTIVVIGYGNDLRGDDAVGPRTARAVAAWDVPDICGLAVHQLTPELAEILATAERVIFVDARVPTPSPTPSVSFPPRSTRRERRPEGEAEEIVEVRPIEPAPVDSALGHTGDPRALLALAAALYGRCPPAWSITVPARCFAFGAGLSPAAERGLAIALQRISALIANATYATNQPQRAQRTQRD